MHAVCRPEANSQTIVVTFWKFVTVAVLVGLTMVKLEPL